MGAFFVPKTQHKTGNTVKKAVKGIKADWLDVIPGNWVWKRKNRYGAFKRL